MSLTSRKKLKKNYSTKNFKTLENGNNYKLKYSTTTYNTNLNDSIEEEFHDDELDEEIDDFDIKLDSFYEEAKEIEDQHKEINDFNKVTENKIKEIKKYYNVKMKNFKDNYPIKKEEIISNYKENLQDDPFWGDFYNELKIKTLEEKLDNEYNDFLKSLKKRKNKAVSRYKEKRDLELEELKKKHKNNKDYEFEPPI